jgi:hypothetical protein
MDFAPHRCYHELQSYTVDLLLSSQALLRFTQFCWLSNAFESGISSYLVFGTNTQLARNASNHRRYQIQTS